jgi:hypothetical protein
MDYDWPSNYRAQDDCDSSGRKRRDRIYHVKGFPEMIKNKSDDQK